MTQTLQHSSPEVQALLNGESRGIDQIYHKSYGVIENLILKMQGTRDDARDIFQQSLFVVYQKVKNPDFKLTCSFQTFLYAIAKNLWRDQLKKKNRSEVTLNESVQSIDENVVEEVILEAKRQSFYQKMFKQLPEDCQTLLKMHFEGLSMRQIAEKWSSTEGYIRKKKHGCKKKLMERMQSDPIYEELKHS